MATLLSILLVIVPNCFASGPPASPSLPKCNIGCGKKNDCVDIHCSWDPKPDPETNYSLHWEPAISVEGHVINGTSFDGIIQRKHFKHGELRVWVQAKNQHGSAKSQDALFNTADITQPLPPKVWLVTHQESLEMSWNSTCDEQQLSWGHCDVQYRTEGDQGWFQDMDVLHGSYTVDRLQPGTVYEFQVRCSCDTGLMSDWSAIYRIRSTETAPEGELDVWRDCGISQKSSDCVVTWKKLPVSQAHGRILGYEVRLSYNNNVLVTVTPVQPMGYVACEEMQCHFTSPLKDVASVSVSAYNACGATVPSYLAMPIPGKEKNEQAIRLVMNEEKLTVSWDLPSQLSDHMQEYVVQYKQAGSPPGDGFDWIKVEKSQTTGIFEGRYRKYTPYQVSLFTVSHSSKVHHLSSAIGYSLQGTPSKVPSFKVFYIAPTDVTLFWKCIDLSQQNGVILYYQIVLESGADRQNGHLVAVVLGISLLVVTCVVLVLCACRAPCFSYKVPDARNSHIFLHMKHQMNDSLARICIPVSEPNPQISLLEVVEIQPWALKYTLEKTADPDGLTRLVVGDGGSQVDCQDDQREEAVAEECHGTDHKYEREEYSKMVDSDEEREREENMEDVWSSSGEEQPVSGYEKHFMPTALEILEA
ncbi:interleukin 12 receptor, beta 2a, like isoform X2 [Cyclopterus lumpus]|uniref:interleukin 12 receptor, beta 2a, like isoform X2 n=1 Tax=Cyclopterus lumpus TaxID=8103 RepID=UPI001486EC02|nr:interleukin 12 receptor, beta 2a, like isoform X2 [Cyclopterus lumpus]